MFYDSDAENSTSKNVNHVRLTERTSAPATPPSGSRNLYATTAGLQEVDSAGATRSIGAGHMAAVALAAVDTGGGVFSWQNPEATAIAITRILVDVTTVAASACTLDIGGTAASATTLSDTLLDGIDVHTATGLFDNLIAAEAGTNGLPSIRLAAGKWVTGSKASGASAGLAGTAYIFYSTLLAA